MDYLRPILEPLAQPEFTFTRDWMREQAARIGDPRNEAARVGRMLNLPPEYLLLHRVTLGSIGVLCQLGARAPYRQIAETGSRDSHDNRTDRHAAAGPPANRRHHHSGSSLASIDRDVAGRSSGRSSWSGRLGDPSPS